MPTVTVLFHGLDLTSRSLDGHLLARVRFTLRLPTREITCLSVDVKRIVGSSPGPSSLEVSRPHGYDGPFNHWAMQQAVEAYCHDAFKRLDAKGSVEQRRPASETPSVVDEEAQYEMDIGAAPAGW